MALITFSAAAQRKMSTDDYINLYKEVAVRHMKQYGIPASIKLAQGIIESGNGGSRLAVQANNHFGIKCKTGWKGATISHDDDDKGECFRKYRSAEESYTDHSVFLSTTPRYALLFELSPTDYEGWARGLKACGYATNPQYAEILIRVIEDYNLHVFDAGEKTAGGSSSRPTGILDSDLKKTQKDQAVVPKASAAVRDRGVNNGVGYVTVREGDTFKALAREAGLTPRKLMTFNDLPSQRLPEPGGILYVQSKQKRSSVNSMHYVKAGETIYSIAQKEAVTVKALKKMNPQLNAAPPYVGQEIRLR